MSEQPNWMPSDEEIHRHLIAKGGIRTIGDYCRIVAALISTAVEKALAEQEERHKREVIEARLEELIDYGECTCVTLGGTCAAHVHENELRADLAALEVTP